MKQLYHIGADSTRFIYETKPNKLIEKYKLYMYMGALFNTAIMWIQNGKRESVEDITDMFCSMCGIDCPE